MRTRPVVLLVSSLVAILGMTACGDDDGSAVRTASASGSGSGSVVSDDPLPAGCQIENGIVAQREHEVHVTLDEYSISLDRAVVDAGIVELDVKNAGTMAHEVVVISGATPDELNITDSGLDTGGMPEGAEVVGKVSEFEPGLTCPGLFRLAPGDYTLLCNLISKDHAELSFADKGMATSLTVR